MLQNFKKGPLHIKEYLLKIKNVVGLLASVGHVVSISDHVEANFSGLTEEYDTFLILVNSHSQR